MTKFNCNCPYPKTSSVHKNDYPQKDSHVKKFCYAFQYLAVYLPEKMQQATVFFVTKEKSPN